MRTLLGVAVFVPVWLSPALGAAHLRLTSPPARYVQDDSGLKRAPCGSGTATGTVTRVAPGQALEVTWRESVGHAGHFRIALAADPSDFVEPTSLDVPEPAPSWVLADGIADQTGTRTYSRVVELPNRECRACVLQVIQVMSNGPDGTNTGPFSGVYHACADLDISAMAGDGGVGGDAAVTPDTSPDLRRADLGPASTGGRGGATGGTGGAGGFAAGGTGSGGAAGVAGAGGEGGAAASGGERGGTGGAAGGGGVTSAGGEIGSGGAAGGTSGGGGGGVAGGSGGAAHAAGSGGSSGEPAAGTGGGPGGTTASPSGSRASPGGCAFAARAPAEPGSGGLRGGAWVLALLALGGGRRMTRRRPPAGTPR